MRGRVPRLRWLPAPRLPRLGFWPTVLLLAWGGLVCISMAVTAAGVPVPTCLFESATGVPCPTCGGTRAAGHLLRGDAGTAFTTNPLVTGLLVLLVLTIACCVIWRRRPALRWPDVPAAWTWSVAVGFVLLNWAYVIATLG